MSWVECPECDEECKGGQFGDDAYCPTCDKAFRTDWDYSSYDSMGAWVTGEITDVVELNNIRQEYNTNKES